MLRILLFCPSWGFFLKPQPPHTRQKYVCLALKHLGSYFVQILFIFLPCMWGRGRSLAYFWVPGRPREAEFGAYGRGFLESAHGLMVSSIFEMQSRVYKFKTHCSRTPLIDRSASIAQPQLVRFWSLHNRIGPSSTFTPACSYFGHSEAINSEPPCQPIPP